MLAMLIAIAVTPVLLGALCAYLDSGSEELVYGDVPRIPEEGR